MNSLEAKFILEACRVGELDASDPKIAEALEAMESDPELAQWFAATQELDRAVIAKLRTVPVPEDLMERIRAGKSVADHENNQWTPRQWLYLAALVVVLGALAMLLIPRSVPADLATFRDEMAEFMDRRWDHSFDLAAPEFAKVKQWLESRTDSIQIDLPLTLAASRTIGCKTFSWHRNTATLICFTPKNAGTVVHVFIVNRSAVTDAPGEEPQLARLTNWNSAIWSRGDKVYLALTTAEADKLTRCL